MKQISVNNIIVKLGAQFLRVAGTHEGYYVDNLADAAHVNLTSLDWVNKTKTNKQEIVKNSPARVILVDESVEYEEGKVLIYVRDPKLALAIIGNSFFVERPKPGIHSTAIIDPDAEIGIGVYIGPYSVIGKAIIGDDCIIESNVRIYDGVIMGNGCSVKPGAVLGGEGFGFEKDSNGNKFRFPQIGRLIIGDDVEIGANTCIDRGALSDTVIGDYTKINNLCHIAHNNKIGRNVTITGCVNVSGSNVIEDEVWIAPNASVRGYIHLGKGCVLGMGAVATKDIPEGETWVGNPARNKEK